MSRPGNADFYLTINTADQDILHERSVDIFHGIFIQRFLLGYTGPDIGKGLFMVDDLTKYVYKRQGQTGGMVRRIFLRPDQRKISKRISACLSLIHI